MQDGSSKLGSVASDDDPSVTDIAGPSIIRERTPEIERGMVLAGRYQVEAIIGKGGSGVVLRAFDRTAQAVVALKVLKRELVYDQRWSKRFSRELRLGRPIRHPNVCRIFDIGEGDGHRFLTMELATGGTLRELIKRGESLRPLPERLADAHAAISGLAAIHEAGIVHRDVKPDNMLRMDDGRLVLSDFGLATDVPAEAGVTVMVGTPHYMAPEVRAGEPATTRSDVWSLGVVLYEILFGKRPERRSSSGAEGMAKPPAPLTASPTERAMLALCERCLAENPVERPANAAAVLRLFDAACSSPRRFVHGRQWMLGSVAVSVLAAGVMGLAHRAHRRHQEKIGVGALASSPLPRVIPIGEPIDWSKGTITVASFPGHVHCFSMLDQHTAEIVWGTPKRAENVDVMSGRRVPATLLPETYAVGCPARSPRNGAVLFSASNSAGVSEIRLSRRPDGADATTVIVGSAPLWLTNGDEFIYDIDSRHVALFSLKTMRFTLLPDSGLNGRETIAEKAVSLDSNTVAVLFLSGDVESVLAVYDPVSLNRPRTLLLPSAHELRYDGTGRDLWVSYRPTKALSTLISVDWRAGSARNLGRVPGFDIVDSHAGLEGVLLLARRKTSDAWVYEGPQRRRITDDGETFSAAISAEGNALLGRRTGEKMTIWSSRDGVTMQLTSGPMDVEPDFAPDGKRWAYADYAKKTIEVCSLRGRCNVLIHDERLPSFPRFSPDGNNVAFITQAAPSRLRLVSVSGGDAKDLGSAYWQCPPVWTSATSIWTIEGSGGDLVWSERDAATGAPTGRRTPVNGAVDPTGYTSCVPPDADRASPLLPRVRVEAEEQALLLRLEQGVR